jgi:hypothetical protein
MRRVVGSTFGPTFFASACVVALSRIAARLFRLKVKIGMETSYIDTDMGYSSGCEND